MSKLLTPKRLKVINDVILWGENGSRCNTRSLIMLIKEVTVAYEELQKENNKHVRFIEAQLFGARAK